MSYVEIYNERLHDLASAIQAQCSPGPPGTFSHPLHAAIQLLASCMITDCINSQELVTSCQYISHRQHQALLIVNRLSIMQDMRKRKAGLEVKERHGQTCVPGALLVRVDTVQAALALVQPLHWFSPCIGAALALVQPLHWYTHLHIGMCYGKKVQQRP